MSTVYTGGHSSAAAAVDEQNGLLSPAQIQLQFFQKLSADAGRIALPQLTAHIGQNRGRQRRVLISLGQGQQMIFARLCSVIAFYRRSCGSHQQQTVILCCTVFCHFPGMITRIGLRFVSGFLFFVNNHAAKVVQWRKHCGSGANDHPCLAALDPAVLVIPLRCRQAAVHDCHLIPEIQAEFFQHLRGQRDFRHQQDGVFPLVQRVLDEANIHLGFAAAGNAVQQRCLGLAALLQLLQPQKGGLLLLIQCNRLRCFGFQQFGHPTDLNGFCGQNSQRYQTPDERSTHTGQVAHLFFWQLPCLMDHPQHLFPPFFQRALTDLAQGLFQR